MTVRIVGSRRMRARKVDLSGPALAAAKRGVSVFVDRKALEHVLSEGISAFRAGRECIGLLYGVPFLFDRRKLVKVERAVALPAKATQHHVSVDREGVFPEWGEGIGGMLIVGWYHSHTGVGNFMSRTDEITHRRWFTSDYSISIVFDAGNGSIQSYMSRDGSMGRVDFEAC